MAFSAKAVANEILELAEVDGKKLTPMQLLKLVYFAYGWYYAIYGERLINERVEAWQYGPVFPTLYHELKRFGSGAIGELTFESEIFDGKLSMWHPRLNTENSDPGIQEQARQVIGRVWEVYKNYTAAQLSAMTHEGGTPWAETPNKEIRGTDISDELIQQYFSSLANRTDEPRSA